MPTAEVHVRNAVSDFRDDIGKKSWKHATDLSHAQRVYFARNLGRLPVRYFGLISLKATLDTYKEEIGESSHKFYNKCSQYLLENICQYLAPKMESSDDLSIVFEDRNHDFDAMRRFLTKVKDNPIRPQSKHLRHLNPFSISVKKKGEEDILEVADFVAHSIFQCVNRSESNFQIPEPRYFNEISSRFAGDERGCVVGRGLKLVHSINEVRLDPDIEKMFAETRCVLPSSK